MEPLHQPNNIIAKKYRIINTLGEGGSGVTYLAQDLENNKSVALKALSLHRMTDWKAEEVIHRRYRILDTLGQGAVAITYLAQDLENGKNLALKVLYLCRMTDWKWLKAEIDNFIK